MDHDKNWGQDAPQDQDKRTVREVYPSRFRIMTIIRCIAILQNRSRSPRRKKIKEKIQQEKRLQARLLWQLSLG